MERCFNIANNQIIFTTDHELKFFSYGSFIASYKWLGSNKKELTLSNLYDYSRTTSKYLKIFLNEYCYFYYNNTNELRKYIKNGGCDNVIVKVID